MANWPTPGELANTGVSMCVSLLKRILISALFVVLGVFKDIAQQYNYFYLKHLVLVMDLVA